MTHMKGDDGGVVVDNAVRLRVGVTHVTVKVRLPSTPVPGTLQDSVRL